MTNDAEWCRAMGKTLLRSAEARRHNNDLYSAMRELAFMCQAVALCIEDDDDVAFADTEVTYVGVVPPAKSP